MNQVEEFVYGDLCLHPICKQCMLTYLDKEYVNAKGIYKYPCPYPSCKEEIPYYQLAVQYPLFSVNFWKVKNGSDIKLINEWLHEGSC